MSIYNCCCLGCLFFKRLFQKKVEFLSQKNHIGSLFRTIVFSIGHYMIDFITTYYVTGADVSKVALSAFLSPLFNAILFFLIDRFTCVKAIKHNH